MPTTEIATMPLVPGSELGDPNNPAAIVMKDCGNMLQQADGMQGMQFGMQVEDPSVMQMFLDWDSKQHHEDFRATDAYGPFSERFKSILSGAPSVFHVDLKPDGGLKSTMSAPVTEVATFYFDGAPPDDAFESCKKFIDMLQKDGSAKVSGWAYGITYEEIEREGVKGKGAVLTIGWDSVQDHMDFRQTQCFKDNIGLLRQTSKKIEMHHVQFMNFVE